MSYTWKKSATGTATQPIHSATSSRAAAEPKTTGYVPPAKREAAPKPFEEEFPILSSAAATAVQKPTLNFGEMMKATAAGALMTTATTKERVYVSGNTRLRVIDDGPDNDITLPTVIPGPTMNNYRAKVNARATADARRRRRIFDSSSEEEIQQEVPDSDSIDDNESDGDGQEEEGDTYDADAFDRHR
jgi:hypothetical protein